MLIENDENTIYFSNGNNILAKEEAYLLIEKCQRFYQNISSEEIEAVNKHWDNEREQEMSMSVKKSIVEREEEERRYAEKYDNASCSMSEDEIMNFYQENAIPESKINNLDRINYPLIVVFYKNEKPIYAGTNKIFLERYVFTKRQTLDFDNYFILEVNEDDLYGVLAYLNIHLIKVPLKRIPVYNGLYVTFNQIKRRFKSHKNINLWVIKKIIDIYHIPKYLSADGGAYVKKDEFDRALAEYMGWPTKELDQSKGERS
jgi:hypothetical protein